MGDIRTRDVTDLFLGYFLARLSLSAAFTRAYTSIYIYRVNNLSKINLKVSAGYSAIREVFIGYNSRSNVINRSVRTIKWDADN